MSQDAEPSIIFDSVVSQLIEEEERIPFRNIRIPDEVIKEYPIILSNQKNVITDAVYKPAEKLSKKAFNDAIQKIGFISERINEEFKERADKPSKIELSFGLAVEGGISTVVSATAACEFAVKITWEPAS